MLALCAPAASALAAPPANDDFGQATSLTGPQATLTGTTSGAIVGPGEPSYDPGVWFRYTPERDGYVELATCTAYEAHLAVYTGAQPAALTWVETDQTYGECDGGDDLHAGFHADAGVAYSIFLGGYGDAGPYTLRLNPPPLNDDLADARVLNGEASVEGSTLYATREPGEPAHAGETGGASVWFAFTPAFSGPATFDVCDSAIPAVLAVYSGAGMAGLSPVASSASGSCRPVTFDATAGRRYLLAVDSRGGARGDFVLHAPPSNDARKAPWRVGLGAAFTESNRGATAEPGEPAHAGRPARASLWYELETDRDQPISIDTCGSLVDTTLAVYAEGLGTVAENDDAAACGPGSTASRVTFAAQPGVSYRIAVDGAATGDVRLTISPANDDVAHAHKVTPANSPFYGSTSGATREPGEPELAGGSVWYRWTAPSDGTATVDTCSVFDETPATTALAVYTGATASTLVPVATGAPCGPGSAGARTAFTAVAGETYRIAVAASGPTGYFVLHLSSQPDNDAFAAAAELGSGASGSTFGATREPGEPLHAGVAGGASRWYRFSAAGPISLRFCADFDAVAAVYTGTSLASLTPVASSAHGADCATLAFTAAAGQTYDVAIDGRDGAAGSFSLTLTTAPPNDDFARAVPLTFTTTYVANAGATAQAGEPAHAGVPAGHSVWYTLTPAASARVVLDTCGSFGADTVLAVYRGSALDALTPVASSDDAADCGSGGSRLIFDAVAGETYRVAVDTKDGEGGFIQLAYGSAPANDDFGDADPLGAGDQVSGIIDGAGEQPGEPAHAGIAGAGSVWFELTPQADGPVVLSACGSSFDTLLAVYTGTALTELTPVAASDDSNECGLGSHASRVTFPALAGVTYRIAIDGKPGASGRYQLQVIERPANDDFAHAVALGDTTAATTGRIDLATTEPAEPGDGGASVWYAITASRSGLLAVDVCAAEFDAGVAVYTGTTLGSLAPAGTAEPCDDGTGRRVTLTAQAGTTYWIAVSGQSGAMGYFTLRRHLRPPNDDFAAAQPLTTSVTGDTTNATHEPGEPQHAGVAGGGSVWYRYDATRSATLRLDTCEENQVDTLLAVYTGTELGALTPVAASDDGCGTGSRVALHVDAGRRYWIAVDGYGGARGSFWLSVLLSPANDAIADAAPLGAHPSFYSGSTVYATSEPGEPEHAGQPAATSVWHTFTPATSGGVSISTCSSFFAASDTRLAVYTGAPGALTPVAANDDDPSCFDGIGAAVSFNAQAGVTYLIAVDNVDGATGGYELRFGYAPANDAFTGAIDLGASPYITSGFSSAASREPGEPHHAGRTGGASVWYRFTPAASHRVTIDTCGAQFDTLLAVYTGTSVDALTEVASDDDSPNCASGHGSWLTLDLIAGTTYRVAIDGRDGASGYYLLDFVYNDAFADATKIVPGSTTVLADPHAATLEPGEPGHAGATRSVWFDYTATRNGPVSFDTCSAQADTVLGVYTGGAVDALTQVATSDDACGAGSRVSFDAVNGTTYHIAVAVKGSSGPINFLLAVTVAPPNDGFSDAVAIDPNGLYAQYPTLAGATHEAGEPAHAGIAGNGSVWYTLTPTRSARVSLDTCASSLVDTQLAVYTGASVAALTPVASADDTPLCGSNSKGARVAFDAQAGVTYRIAVDSKGSPSGFAQLQIVMGPANDAFAAAATLTAGDGVNASNALAGHEPGEPAHAGDSGGGSLWYAYTAPASGRVVVDTCSSRDLDTVLAVYTGASVDQLTPVAANDDACGTSSRIQFDATAGTAYRIAVDGKGGATGHFRIRLAVPPANDDFAGATSLSFSNGSQPFSNRAAGRQAGEPEHAAYPGGASVWYRITATRSVPVTLDTCDTTEFDSLLAVYTGTRVDALTPVAASDDGCGAGGSVTFAATAGRTYWLAVDGKGGATGDGVLEVTTPPENDAFADATALALGNRYVDLRGATHEPGEPQHAGQPGGPSVWFRYTPAADGVVTLDTCSVYAGPDTLLAVYTGDSLATLMPVAANDDSPGCGGLDGRGSSLSFAARAGTTYRIALDAKSGAAGYVQLDLAQPPANDDFDAAEVLGGDHLTAFGTTLGASAESGEPQHAGQPGGTSVWYAWTATKSGSVTVDTCSGVNAPDTLLGVYTGTSVAALTPVAANDNGGCGGSASYASRVTFTAQAGTTYRIAVDGRYGSVGQFTLALSLPPANDAFADARVLNGQTVQLTTTNRRATVESGEPSHGGRPGGASVWYRWTAPTSGTATIETCGSDFDTLLAVYRGTSLAGLTPVASDDDSCWPGGRVAFTATAGTEYRIAVDGYLGATGTIRLAVNAPANDLLLNARSVSGAAVDAGGSNVGAGLEPYEVFHAGDRGGASVWFAWTAPASGPVDLDTCGSDFDTLLDVYTGYYAYLPLEATNDDGTACGSDSRQSALRFQAVAGTSYLFAIDGKGGATGTYQLHLRLGADTTPPVTSLLSAPPPVSNDTTPTFVFGADEPADFECALDGADLAPCATPATLGPLADGAHTLRVRAVDRAGNRDETPVTWTFTIDTVPPETAFAMVPPDRTASSRPQLRFSSPDGTRFECAVDAGEFTPCTSPYTTPQLADGQHTVAVRAFDAAGNADPSPAQTAFTVDTTPPVTTKLEGPAGTVGTSTVTFKWDAGEPGATFACSLDGSQFSDCDSPRTISGLSDDDHVFRVRATDDVGNVETTPVEWAFTVEATPPETTLDDGPPPFVRDASVTLKFSSSERNSTFECTLDGQPAAVCSSPYPLSDLAEGDHLVTVRAIDRAGNRDPSPASRSFTVDRTAPQTTISGGPDEVTKDPRPGFSFTAGEPVSFECALDGGAFAACGASYAPPTLADGPHTVAVRAVDRAGNVDDTPATRTFTVDTRAPDVHLDAPSGTVSSASATFEFSADEPATFACSLDGEAFAGCTSPQGYTALSDGHHTFRVRATDAAGNASADRTAAFTVDTHPPTTTLTGPPAVTSATTAHLVFAADESDVSYACTLDGAPRPSCASPVDLGGLSEGAHVFAVTATDAVGNVESPAAERRWRVDLTPPETTVSPAPSGPVRTPPSLTLGSSESPARFTCAVDEAAARDCMSPYTPAGLADGDHVVRVSAVDEAGNADASPEERRFTLDTTPPVTTLDGGPTGPTRDRSASFPFHASEAVDHYECAFGGGYESCDPPFVRDELADGEYTLSVRAVDPAGNIGAPATRSFRVDTRPPRSFVSGPTGATNITAATFRLDADETGVRFECAFDSDTFAPCDTGVTYGEVPEGEHHFAVRAIDSAGNVETEPVERTLYVDRTPPETTIVSGPDGPVHHGPYAFTYHGDEGTALECRVDDETTWRRCEYSPAPDLRLDEMAPGEHVFYVRAIDPAGNVDPTPAERRFTIVDAAPTPSLSVTPDAGPVELSVTATLGGSDPDAGDELGFTLDWGDGSAVESGALPSAARTHVYRRSGTYVARLTVRDAHSHVTTARTISVSLPEPLRADAGEDLQAFAGRPVTLDGGNSRPLAGVDGYHWDFGDGQGADGVTATHTYAEPGTYVARLTVRGGPDSDSDTATVTVLPEPVTPGLEVTVRGAGGAPLAGADVAVTPADGPRVTAITDAQGRARLHGLADGAYSVAAYRNGYRPARADATLAGGEGAATITLEPGEIVQTQLASRPMTLDEIEAAGIDVNDPANQHAYSFHVHLSLAPFEGDPGETDRVGDFSGVVTGTGFYPDPVHTPAGLTCTPLTCHYEVDGGTVFLTWEPGEDGAPEIVTALVIPFKATWLKEFYDVKLAVLNLADESFSFKDGAATLELQPGLSLAPTAQRQTYTKPVPDIPGGGSAAVDWVIRGDEKGLYKLAASYGARLDPFDRSIRGRAEMTEPLRVWGSDALHVTVKTDELIQHGHPFHVDVEMKNVADVPIYNPAVELLEEGRHGYIEQPRQQRSFQTRAIMPGETFDAGPFILVSAQEGNVDLAHSFIHQVGGDSSPQTTLVTRPRTGTTPQLSTAEVPYGVRLDWEPVAGAQRYEVYRTADLDTPFGADPIATTTGTSATIGGLDPAAPAREYAISTVIDSRHTLFHPVVAAQAGEPPPPPPPLPDTPPPGNGGTSPNGGHVVTTSAYERGLEIIQGKGCQHEAMLAGVKAIANCFQAEKDKLTVVASEGSAPTLKIAGVDLVATGSGSIVYDAKEQKLSGDVQVRVGDVVLWKRGFLTLPIKSSFTLATPEGTTFKGLPIKGGVTFQWHVTSVTVDANLELPKALGGVTVAANLEVDLEHGLKTAGLSLDAETLKIGSLGLKHAEIKYERTDEGDRWQGSLIVQLPAQSFGGMEVSGTLTIVNGRFRSIALELSKINKHLGYGVFLQALRARVQADPFGFGGGATFTFGPAINKWGLMKADGDVDITFGSPAIFRIKGKLYLADLETRSAEVEYRTSGTLKFTTTAGIKKGPLTAQVTAEGWVEHTAFNAEGDATFKVSKAQLSGEGVISSVGVAVCRHGIGPDAGAGYKWGDHSPHIFSSSCGIGPYEAKPRAATAQAGTDVVQVPAGQPLTALAFAGQGAPPALELTGPDGTSVRTSPTGEDVITDRAWIVQDPDSATTYVALDRPRAGAWHVQTLPGSAPIASVAQAQGLPQPRVTARVRKLRGGRARLQWRLRPIAGQRVRLMERNAGVAHTIALTSAASGHVVFRPQSGPRARRIEAVIEQDGLVRTTLHVGGFAAAPPARPGAVRALRLSRRGAKLSARWRPVRGAAGYEVLVRTPDGRVALVETRRPRVTVQAGGQGLARVRVRALNPDRLAGAPVTRALRLR